MAWLWFEPWRARGLPKACEPRGPRTALGPRSIRPPHRHRRSNNAIRLQPSRPLLFKEGPGALHQARAGMGQDPHQDVKVNTRNQLFHGFNLQPKSWGQSKGARRPEHSLPQRDHRSNGSAKPTQQHGCNRESPMKQSLTRSKVSGPKAGMGRCEPPINPESRDNSLWEQSNKGSPRSMRHTPTSGAPLTQTGETSMAGRIDSHPGNLIFNQPRASSQSNSYFKPTGAMAKTKRTMHHWHNANAAKILHHSFSTDPGRSLARPKRAIDA